MVSDLPGGSQGKREEVTTTLWTSVLELETTPHGMERSTDTMPDRPCTSEDQEKVRCTTPQQVTEITSGSEPKMCNSGRVALIKSRQSN